MPTSGVAEGGGRGALRVLCATDANSSCITQRVVHRAGRTVGAGGEAMARTHAILSGGTIVRASALHAHVEREVAARERSFRAMRIAEAGHAEVRHRVAMQLRNVAVGVDRAIARIAALAVVSSGGGVDDDRRVDGDRRVGAGHIARR